MLGLVHPCKIYNIFAVGAPVAYVGPRPSHITDIFDQLQNYPAISVQHGEATALADHIRRMAAVGIEREHGVPPKALAVFSKRTLLPKMIAAVENQAAPQPRSSIPKLHGTVE